jgi:hypothetical protein
MLNLPPIDRVRERLAIETGPDQMETTPDATFAFYWNNLVNFDGLIASRSRRQFQRRQFQQLLFRSVVHLDLEHRKIGFEIPCPFLRRFKRWKDRLHPAIDFQAKALGHHKVSACDVAGLRLVRYRQTPFSWQLLSCPCLSDHRLQTHGTGQW